MANEVANLIYDIGLRLGNPNLSDPLNPVAILRVMNHLYRDINEEYRCLEKKLVIPAGTFSSVVNYYTVPADFMELFNIIPGETTIYGFDYIPKEEWNMNQYQNHDVFTILNGQFVFGNVSDQTALDFYYYSYGLELVNKADAAVVAATETNTPEWNKRFWRLLVYAACLELSPDYPFLQKDVLEVEKIKAALNSFSRNRQSVTPSIMGGLGTYKRKMDPDYVNGQWVTRRNM